MKLLFLIFLCLSAICCDLKFMYTHNMMYKYAYWVLILLFSVFSIYYSLLNRKKTSKNKHGNPDDGIEQTD